MTKQTDPSLVQFVKSLPVANLPQALTGLIQYDSQIDDFQTFILNISPLINFTKISPLKLILDMTHLPTTSPSVQRFVNDSSEYLQLLIQIPDLFYPNYTIDLLSVEFVNYLFSVRNEPKYIINLIEYSINQNADLINFFLNVLLQYFNLFLQNKLLPSLEYLKLIESLFNIRQLRLAFCQSLQFSQRMYSLFSRSVLPGPRSTDFSDYFGDGTDNNYISNHISDLDNVLSLYYGNLVNIVLSLLKGDTVNYAINFLRNFIFDLEMVKNNPTQWMVLLNFESVMLDITFKTKKNWLNADPYTPYMRDAIAPIGDGYPLSVFGHYSWMDPSNIDLETVKRNYDDKDEDIKNDRRCWNQKVRQLSILAVNRPLSDFFFAAHKSISCGSAFIISKLDVLQRQMASEKNPVEKQFFQLLLKSLSILLIVDSRRKKMNEFLFESLRYLVKISGFNYRTKTLPKRPPLEYQYLPEYLLESCVSVLTFYYYSIPYSEDDLNNLINLFSYLFSNKKFIRNPHIAFNIIKFFTSVSQEPMGRGHCYLIVKDTVLELVYPATVEFYSRVEKTGTHTEYYDKVEMRIPCLILMTFWLMHRECRYYFNKHINDQANINFLFYLLKDLTYFMQECINEVTQIKNLLFSRSLKPLSNQEREQIMRENAEKRAKKNMSGSNGYTLENFVGQTEEEKEKKRIQNLRMSRKSDAEIDEEIESNRSMLKSNFKIADLTFKLINTIVSFAPFAFDHDEIAKTLISLVKVIFEKSLNIEDLTISNSAELNYDPYYFVTSLASFMSLMICNKNLMKISKDPQTGLDFQLCSKVNCILGNLAGKNKGYNDCSIAFNKYIVERNKEKTLTLDPNVEIPEDLQDPITCELLKDDPVRLPTGNVFNRSTIDWYEKNNAKDPMTQEPFDIKLIVPADDIRQRALEFFEKHAIESS